MRKIKMFFTTFICLLLVFSTLNVVQAKESYLLNDAFVSNFNGQENNNYANSNNLILGKGRHVYMRFDLTEMNVDEIKSVILNTTKLKGNYNNTYVINQCSEYLRIDDNNESAQLWDESNITYNNRPLDLSDYQTISQKGDVDKLNITDLVVAALKDGKETISLHITTLDVDDDSVSATEVYSSRSANGPNLLVETASPEVDDDYVISDSFVNKSQPDANFQTSNNLIIGKGRHVYLRLNIADIDVTKIENITLQSSYLKGNTKNTFVITECSEFLRADENSDSTTLWDVTNITYNNRPRDLADTLTLEQMGNVTEIDLTEMIKNALSKGQETISLHITTKDVDNDSVSATEIYSSRSETGPYLKVSLTTDEKPSDINAVKVEDNYYDSGAISQKIFKIKNEDDQYLKLDQNEGFDVTTNSEEASVFGLYIFDYQEYEYSQDSDIDWAKTFYAIKCLDNNKYLTIQNYFDADDENKVYYNKISDGYEVKATANEVNWNERFNLEYYAESNYYTIASHLTVYRDDAGYYATYIEMDDDKLFAANNNRDAYKFYFEDVGGHEKLEVMQEVSGYQVNLSWYPVNNDTDSANYTVENGQVTFDGKKFNATVENLSVGNNEITVSYTGESKQEVTLNVRVFNHPGVTHSMEDLEKMQEHIANKEEPWYSDYQKLQTMVPDNMSSSNYETVALEGVGRGDPAGHGNISNFEQGGNAAYYSALQWVITGEDKYADCAVNILNAWSTTLKIVDGRDRILGAGINSYRYINAAEILKYYHGGYSGYSDEDFKQFQSLLENVIYPVIEDLGAPMIANGNWDTAAMITIVSIGVICDNTEIYDRAVSLYQDIHVNGSIVNYVSDWGQSVESFRDQAHAQLGIGYMAEVCQVALNQGQNLYELYNNRLARAFNWAAQYNLYNTDNLKMEPLEDVFGNTKWTEVDSEKINRGELRPVYELPLAYYSKIDGVDITWMEKAAEAMRAQGYVHNDNLNFGTLTTYNGEPTDVCQPFFQIRTRLEPWYQRTWNDVKKYGEIVDNIPETLNSYFTVTETGEVTASSKKADAPYFQIENNQDGTYAIRCVTTNTYLSVTDELVDGENIIKANQTAIGDNEKFVLKSTGAAFYYLESASHDNRIVYVHVENEDDPANATLSLRLGTKITNSSAEIENDEKLILMYNTRDVALSKIELADTSKLEALISELENINNDDNKYTNDSFQRFSLVLQNAKQGVIDAKNGKIDSLEVQSLYDQLKTAYNQLDLVEKENEGTVSVGDSESNKQENTIVSVDTGDDSEISQFLAMICLSGLLYLTKFKRKTSH